MKFWIKRLAAIEAIFDFFIVLFTGLNPVDPFNTTVLIWALGKASLAAFFLWIAGIIMGDVILKGVVEDIAPGDIEKLDDGLMQHVRVAKNKPQLEIVRPDHPAVPPVMAGTKKG